MEKAIALDRKLIDRHSIGAGAERIELLGVITVLLAVCVALPLVTALVPAAGWLRNGGEQLIMGSAVNCALIYAAVNFKGRGKTAAVVFLPSVAHIALFLILSTSVFGLYMLPAVWLGNCIVVGVFKHLHVRKKRNYLVTAAVAVALKVGVIFGVFSIFAAAGVIPQAVAAGMAGGFGVNQILVGAVGCLAAFFTLSVSAAKRHAGVR